VSPALERVITALRDGDRWLITGHAHIDGDCLGSMLAVEWLLAKLGKKAFCVAPDELPRCLTFLPGADRLVKVDEIAEPFERVVVVDSELERTGPVYDLIKDKVIVNIDHHQSNVHGPGIRWVDPSAAATGELIFHLIEGMGFDPDEDCATCLYTALMSDTGGFRFSNTSADTLAIASRLVQQGASPAGIAEALYEERPFPYFILLGHVLSSISLDPSGRLAWSVLPGELIASQAIHPADLDGFVHYLRMIKGVEIAILFQGTLEGEVKVSLRSRKTVNVADLAAKLGGGGHPRAAGCTLSGSLDEIIPKVTALALSSL
jgi:phosphoesterase RecJ-like protein